MKYLITGAGGMLGHDLQEALAGREVTALSRAELDVTDADAVLAAVADHDVVINAAAYTKVDDAESHEDEAYAINATGAANLARAAAKHGAILVQLSTDYVFDGTATTPYAEDAPLNPVSAYGRTKGEGERLAQEANPDRTIIIRTAWLYGAARPQFREDHAAACSLARDRQRRHRPGGATDLDTGSGEADRGAARLGCDIRNPQWHGIRRSQLVRVRAGNLQRLQDWTLIGSGRPTAHSSCARHRGRPIPYWATIPGNERDLRHCATGASRSKTQRYTGCSIRANERAKRK